MSDDNVSGDSGGDGGRIATFEFKVGDEFKTADQVVDGLMHFGLIEHQDKVGLDLVVVHPFSIGWIEEEDKGI